MKKTLLLMTLLFLNYAMSQETVGLVYNNVNLEKSPGYTLFTSLNDNRILLINNCGEVVNQWTSDWGTAPNQTSRMVYLLENGNLLLSSGFNVQIKDWNNNPVWGINYQDEFGFRIHHDIEPLPNGNILVLVRDPYTNTEMFDAGLDTSFTEDTLVLERIVEIQPVGTDTANIVWEWKLFDHLVQEFDASKANFGVVADNPQLLDVNYEDGHGTNPIHANAVEYNAALDQIAVSSRHLKEVFIIDHSTTTVEAAGHTGGIYGKGGDFLWRWGNPEVYNRGTLSDRKLGRQHDIKWIEDGPHAGKLSVFSNDGYGTDLAASSIHIIDQNDTNGVYAMSAGKFLPEDYFWSYDGTVMGEIVLEGSRSGVQIMSNGNALICETNRGRFTEVNGLGEVVWVYEIPTAQNNTFNQFETPIGTGSFRAHRYPENYPAFSGVTFNNTGIIEDVNSISENCSNLLSVGDQVLAELSVYPNPTKDILNFNSNDRIDTIEVYNITGKVILKAENADYINLSDLTDGMYMVKISIGNNSEVLKILKQ